MKRLRHRIPVRLRHHWKVVAVGTAFLAVLIGLLGTVRVAPLVTSDERADASVVTQDVAGTVDIFDATKPHEITLSYSPDDYERMLDQYWEDGEKEYVEADLVIDGTSVDSVGIRLKGNSTLSGLTRNGERAPNGRFGNRDDGEGAQPPVGGGVPGGGIPGGGVPGGGGIARRGGPSMSSLKAEEPENLPWLISFDEFVEGRRYQGHAEIAVRPAGMRSQTGLNEAVALSLVNLAGEPSQGYAYSSFTVNGRPTVTRLLVEHPDGSYADQLDGEGVLYKSRASSQFTDQGDDPTDYQDDFDQVNLRGSQDLQPLIDLIKWVEHSSDEEFAAGLADRLDTRSFAGYLALQNLLLNFDDMTGPGRNYYLYYNLDTEKFSVITWDLNLSLSGNAAQGPFESGGFGGPMGGAVPGGAVPGGAVPGGAVPGGAVPGGARAQGQRVGPAMGHQLKERALEVTEFKQIYEDVYRELYQKLFASGAASEAVDQAVAAFKAADGTAATGESEANTLRTLIENRTTSLATNEVIKER